MDPITAKLMSAAGAAAEPVYVDDVFSTFVYDGNDTARSIVNGIDLSGEGGMVWIKARNAIATHSVWDTERGTNKAIFTQLENAESDYSSGTLTAFNSNGFSLGTAGIANDSDEDYCSWTFRKCPGFFDVVTYTGNGSNRTISHNLGSVPGSIWIKKRNSSDHWAVYHRSTGETHYGRLNTTDEFFDEATFWNDTAPTSSVFSVGTVGNVNDSGDTYVAYLFAHDDQSFGDDEDEAIIKCGSYTGDGTSDGSNTVDLGFEPQWILTKRTDSQDSWHVCDVIRGQTTHGFTQRLRANTSAAESENSGAVPTSTGFKLYSDNSNNGTFIYIAIRRPHKSPETAAECFDVFTQDGSSSDQLRPGTSGSSVTDMAIIKNRDSGVDWVLGARLLGNYNVFPNSSAAETTARFGTSLNVWDHMSGTFLDAPTIGTNDNGYNYVNYHFARKPGFFDVVAYSGNGSSTRNINHNLGVVPEMMWVKIRSAADNWAVYHSSQGNGKSARLNEDLAFSTVSFWDNTTPTSSVFTVDNDTSVNDSSYTYVAFLFATLPGISKVGSYTGTGSNLDIDCGFTNGARFVLIKRATGTTDWWVLDTARGINAGNDPAMYFNGDAAETSSYDLVDPYSAGFTADAGTAAINSSGETYIFYAIA